MSEVNELRQVARSLSDASTSGGLDERELVTLFFQERFFSVLGYGRVGEDIRLEQRILRGRVDVTLRAFAARPVAVMEFKAPGIPLAGFIDQLSSYTAEVFPEVGILTNGTELWLFRCENGLLLQRPVERMVLANLTTSQAGELYERLRLRHVDLDRLDAVNQCLNELMNNPLPVSSPTEAGGMQFLKRFELKDNTPFGRLVLKLTEALPGFRQHSDFTRGAYEFWRRIYSRQLDFDKTPSSWRQFVTGSGIEPRYQFMFSLETAYAILSRVMLAKAMQDNRFQYIDILRSFARSLETQHVRGRLRSSAPVNAVASVFREAAQQAFTPLFASDIFDWWQDDESFSENTGLGYALAEAALAVFGFDFSPLRGDILGNLYQSYFDPETRLALGEFYTPPEVVDFILDAVGYTGSQVLVSRLLDPACGSGTFLVHALARYIDASQGQDPATILKGLVGGLRVVGFDINPFACLMAQVNYAAQILPIFSQALRQDPHFLIPGIPVLRTDSLRQEAREGEEEITQTQRLQLSFRMEVAGDLANIRTTLPVLKERQEPKEVLIAVPRLDRARDQGLVANVEEYFAALRQMFLAIREGRSSPQEMERQLHPIIPERSRGLATFVAEAARINAETMNNLRSEYGDGRFLKTLEDTALAMVLKNELSYDYVVMNPPYVRIQRISELFRRRWQGMYDWAQGSFDIFIPFIQRSVEGWLNNRGKLGFICSNRFLLANYASPLRRLLPAQAQVKALLDLRDTKVFEKALNYPAICVVEKSAPHEIYHFPASRAFSEPSTGKIEGVLQEARELLNRVSKSGLHEAGNCVDVFAVSSQRLQENAWLLMPASEREVFDALSGAANHYLEDLTLTRSGGFQGYSTSLDDVFVLRAVGDSNEMLRLVPHGGGEPVEIEKALLRPWLFGKDVERWNVDWAGWYVVFPYIEVQDRYQLIPSREYGGQFTYSGQVPFLEDFRGAWRYLKNHEQELRRRESGKFLRGRREEHLWYGATYPRSVDLYHLPKILVQVSSTSSDMALDERGKFVFTAGGTSGVYGIIPNPKKLESWFALALLNSTLLDFYLKHVSTIYEGHTYSYGDQFIKQLPIKLPRTAREKELARRLSDLAEGLSEMKGNLRHLESECRAFPNAQAVTLGSAIELYALRRLVSGEPQSRTVDPRDYSISQMLDGHWGLRLGRATLSFPTELHLRLVEKWLLLQRQTKIPCSLLMDLNLPASETGCHLVLQTLSRTEDEIDRLRTSLEGGESEVDVAVAQLYGLDHQQMQVIRQFLSRF
jgi:hypothetical protein